MLTGAQLRLDGLREVIAMSGRLLAADGVTL